LQVIWCLHEDEPSKAGAQYVDSFLAQYVDSWELELSSRHLQPHKLTAHKMQMQMINIFITRNS